MELDNYELILEILSNADARGLLLMPGPMWMRGLEACKRVWEGFRMEAIYIKELDKLVWDAIQIWNAPIEDLA